MFSLLEQKAKLTHINMREEKHGPDEAVLALDLTIKASVSNDFLSQLSPTLKWSLYDKPVDADLAQDAGYMPVLRYSKLPALAWADAMTEAEVTFHGAVKKKDVVIVGDVNKLVLDCQNGGTVAVTFRIQLSPATPEQLRDLSALLSKELGLSVAPKVEAGELPQ